MIIPALSNNQLLSQNINLIPEISLMPQLLKKIHSNALSNISLDINPPKLLVTFDIMPSLVLNKMPPLLLANHSVTSNPVIVDTGANSIFSPTVSNLDSSILFPVIGTANAQCAGGQAIR